MFSMQAVKALISFIVTGIQSEYLDEGKYDIFDQHCIAYLFVSVAIKVRKLIVKKSSKYFSGCESRLGMCFGPTASPNGKGGRGKVSSGLISNQGSSSLSDSVSSELDSKFGGSDSESSGSIGSKGSRSGNKGAGLVLLVDLVLTGVEVFGLSLFFGRLIHLRFFFETSVVDSTSENGT